MGEGGNPFLAVDLDVQLNFRRSDDFVLPSASWKVSIGEGDGLIFTTIAKRLCFWGKGFAEIFRNFCG